MSETEFWKCTLRQLLNKAEIYEKYSCEDKEDKEAYAEEIFC